VAAAWGWQRLVGGGGPGVAAAWSGGDLEAAAPWSGGGGLEWRRPVATTDGCGRWRLPGGAGARVSGSEKKISCSDYHVRGEGLQWNWMPLLIGEGLHL
jgi:hypothetical protein